MSKKEKLQGNVAATTLFVGVGGIGSKIIREVLDIAKKSNDNLTKTRFVIFDTDVNDLGKADDGISIRAVQTSSPRTIRDYLLQDDDAREEWFPNNMIINGKSVSEGAGQVRAISRLALNATIKTGKINVLYRAIDELYNKDGSDRKQTVKVIIASTVAGGTGSGIAMIIGMLIRNYIAKEYPDSSALIRGFMLMPGVLDALNPPPSKSEKLSLARNGYATVKEINAFMMRPFFESVPELNRYLDLHIDVPNAEGGMDSLKCLPFDFCFLYDRADANATVMPSMPQYRSYAAHSIYEQCIGPMSGKAASKEDNIHKEFLDDKNLGRNRFAGAGASIVRYPYEKIRDYVAYEWIEKKILGHSGSDMSAADREELVKDSWLAFDKKYIDKYNEYKNGNSFGSEPILSDIYTSSIETGDDVFTKMLSAKFIDVKNAMFANVVEEKSVELSSEKEDEKSAANNEPKKKKALLPVTTYYIDQLCARACELYEQSQNADKEKANMMAMRDNRNKTYKSRYKAIVRFNKYVTKKDIEKLVRSFIDSVFNNSNRIKIDSAEYSLESYLSINGKAMHPNAMRYFLYKLRDSFKDGVEEVTMEDDAFKAQLNDRIYGVLNKETGQRNIEPYQVKALGAIGTETTLEKMCEALDNLKNTDTTEHKNCDKMLKNLASFILETYKSHVRFYICQTAAVYLDRLIEQFEEFYNKFEGKVTGLEKRKKTIEADIAFDTGDCEKNLFSNPVHLRKLVEQQKMPDGGSADEIELFSKIFDVVKANALKKEIIKNDAFSTESVDDVFETVIVEEYKKIVENWCTGIDVDIVRACGLEHLIACLCLADRDPNNEEELRNKGKNDEDKNAHLAKIIAEGFNLACPSIIRNDFEESREVSSMAFNKFIEEGDGMKMPSSLFNGEYASETVSKYELHFFKSIYNITPTQIQKLSPPKGDPAKMDGEIQFGEEAEAGMVGSYFTAYQNYMAKIGPDNRLNPVITPHIDKRWNSITVLPELDPKEYQRILMKRIHKALFYGIIYKRITQRKASTLDTDKLIYEYQDGRGVSKAFIVSNHTRCDRFFEVLDSLYFDRYAVHSIHDYADFRRNKEHTTSTPYEESTFIKSLASIDRELLLDTPAQKKLAAGKYAKAMEGYEMPKLGDDSIVEQPKVSIFEIPILYWKSLPKKDTAELDIMIDAIFEIIEKEVKTFADKDDTFAIIAETIIRHYNSLYASYTACPELYDNRKTDVKNNRAIVLIRNKILDKLDSLEVSRTDKFRLCDYTSDDDLYA